MIGANLTGADMDQVNLTGANLANATMSGASLTGVIWLHAVCPDMSSSDAHIGGCFSPLDTAPPVVAVTGVSNGGSYVFGGVPAPHCKTTDNGTVAAPAVLTVATTGSHGVGRFTATCAGAADLAGNNQRAPVHATYTVRYGMNGFLAPKPGSTIARSSKVITVRFRLTTAADTPIPGASAAALAASRHIRATLSGPHISAVTASCAWNAARTFYTCAIRTPAGTRTGSQWRYTITALEDVGTGFLPAPGVRGAADPETVHFR